MSIATTPAAPWAPVQKCLFRFAFIFFVLFIFFNPNGGMPVLNETVQFYIIPLHKFIVWAAAHLLHITKPITYFTGGSGDTTYDWLVLLFITVSAFVGSLIWTLVSRKPVSYDRLYYWLLVLLRFYVAFTMVGYGAVKIIKLQFPMPSPARLLGTYGDSSPMGLAWTFMGYSKGYNYFTGIAELSCGLLLFFRKTTLLGAVIGFTVIANIAAINYCFDVPVKIVSSALLLMVIFILLKDVHRIIKFFILNQTTEPAVLTPRRFQKRWKNISLIVFKYLSIAYMLLSIEGNLVYGMNTYGDDVMHPVLYGIFNTQQFVLNKDTLPPLTTDTTRWRRMAILSNGKARVYLMNDSVRYYTVKKDTVKQTLVMMLTKDTTRRYTFSYTLSKDSVLQLKGSGPNAQEVNATLKRYNEKQYLLLRRGFHFINEVPFNK